MRDVQVIRRDAADADLSDACATFGIDPDAWAPQPACDATSIQLPALGDRYTSWVHVSEGRVVYAEAREDISGDRDAFLYDLETCTEYRISNGCGNQFSPSFWGFDVLFTLYPGGSADTRLYMFDTGSLQFTELHPGLYTSASFYNGRHLVLWGGYEIGDNSKYLFRWNLVTDDLVVLAGEGHAVENISISPTHAAWVDYGGPGKDVFFADLESGVVQHLDSTYDSYTAYTATWGDWVLWEDRRNPTWEVYGYRHNEIHAVDLVAAGILDASGLHVLPE